MEQNGKLTAKKISNFIGHVKVIDICNESQMIRMYSSVMHNTRITYEKKRIELENFENFLMFKKLKEYERIFGVYKLRQIESDFVESLTDSEKEVYRHVIKRKVSYEEHLPMRDSLSKVMEDIDRKFQFLIWRMRNQLPREEERKIIANARVLAQSF